jgi:hypothetical protein
MKKKEKETVHRLSLMMDLFDAAILYPSLSSVKDILVDTDVSSMHVVLLDLLSYPFVYETEPEVFVHSSEIVALILDFLTKKSDFCLSTWLQEVRLKEYATVDFDRVTIEVHEIIL